MEAESGTGGDRDTVLPSLDNSTSPTVVYLAPGTEPLRVEGKVLTPGDYMVLVHYYQPVNPGKKYPVPYCNDDKRVTTRICCGSITSLFILRLGAYVLLIRIKKNNNRRQKYSSLLLASMNSLLVFI